MRDFQLLTPIEIIDAGKERTDLWHLQNVANANFFASIHGALGTKLKGGKDITRKHLYMMPDEKLEGQEEIEDATTPEGRAKIIANIEMVQQRIEAK